MKGVAPKAISKVKKAMRVKELKKGRKETKISKSLKMENRKWILDLHS